MDTGFDGLKRFLAFFGNQPQAAAARAELLERLTQAGRILEAEMLMAAAVDRYRTARPRPALLADMASAQFSVPAAWAMPPLVSGSFSKNSPTCLATKA